MAFQMVPFASANHLSPWCVTITPNRSVLPKKEMHLALFRLVSLTNSTESSYVPFFYQAANFRVRFFPVLRSVLNSQGETEGRQDIPSQEGKCLLVPVTQANRESPVPGPVPGPEGGQGENEEGKGTWCCPEAAGSSWRQQHADADRRAPGTAAGGLPTRSLIPQLFLGTKRKHMTPAWFYERTVPAPQDYSSRGSCHSDAWGTL